MNDTGVICLGKPVKTLDDRFNEIAAYDFSKEIICEVLSIGQSEFYLAAQSEYKPEIKFKIADFLDYEGEDRILYDGQYYEIVRTYRNGSALEITAQRYGRIDCEKCN